MAAPFFNHESVIPSFFRSPGIARNRAQYIITAGGISAREDFSPSLLAECYEYWNGTSYQTSGIEVYGYAGTVASAQTGAPTGMNNNRKGKWRIDISIVFFRKKSVDNSRPSRNWLFMNLWRQVTNLPVNVNVPNSSHKAQINADGTLTGGTDMAGIPASSIPMIASDPFAITSTVKWDCVNGIGNPSPAAPVTLDTTIIMPDTADQYPIQFGMDFYDFSSLLSTGFPPDALPTTNLGPGGGPDGPGADFTTQYGGPPGPHPGEWAIPCPPAVTSGPIKFPDTFYAHADQGGLNPYQYQLWIDANAPQLGLTGVYGPPTDPWTDFSLWRLTVSILRIPPLLCRFTGSSDRVNFLKWTFGSLSSGLVTHWDWDFGDGLSHDTTPNPVHSYAHSGTYTVTLTISDDYGDMAVHSAQIIIPAPHAEFSFAPGQWPSVVFFDKSNYAATWDWDFGDGSPHVTTQGAAHQYPGPGNYNVTLTITSLSGEVSAVSHAVTVTPALTCDFTWTSIPNIPGYLFTPTASAPVTWHWDWLITPAGRGFPAVYGHADTQTIQLNLNPSYSHSVALVVTDALGFTSQSAHGVTFPG